MRKLLLLALLMTYAQTSVTANEPIQKKGNKKIDCPKTCPRGPKGHRGPKGERGDRGKKGYPGPKAEMTHFIEVTTNRNEIVGSGFVGFNPVLFPDTGIQSTIPGGMSLVESTPSSGVFDTITLPLEKTPTDYLVTFAISQESSGEFFTPASYALFLNGFVLTYTQIAINGSHDTKETLIGKTVVVRNPANTAGILRLYSFEPQNILEKPTPSGFSATMTIVKLNNNLTNDQTMGNL